VTGPGRMPPNYPRSRWITGPGRRFSGKRLSPHSDSPPYVHSVASSPPPGAAPSASAFGK